MNPKKVLVSVKHDTSENWAKAVNFVPAAGEVIIYDDYMPPKIKMGNGVTTVNNLKFMNNPQVDETDNILVL